MTEWWKIHYENAKKAYDALMKVYPFTLENLDGEEWRDIAGYEGLYQVSNFGRVKSFVKKTPKILKPFIDTFGYLVVGFHKGDARKNFNIHRLVAKNFIPNIENKQQVNHIDGRPLNNHVSNLEWVTHAENIRHAYRTGLRPSGVKNPLAKFSEEQILYIRENPDELNCRELAKVFEVCPATIGDIQLGRKYKFVKGTVRGSIAPPCVTDDVKQEICRLYVKGSRTFGSNALAKKFGISSNVIIKIVNRGKNDDRCS